MTNTRSKIAASAVLAAASLAAVACTHSGPVAKAPVGDTVISTAGQTPEATAAAVRAAKPDNWVAVPASASSVPAGVLAPGGIISRIKPNGKLGNCTIGPALLGNEVMTAGHCGPAGTPRLLPDGTQVGAVKNSIDEIPADGSAVLDAAVVQLTVPTDAAAARVAGRPIAGVMRTHDVSRLPEGTPVCFEGAKSGINCGPLLNATTQGMEIDVDSAHGDSGAPVFVVDGRTQTVTLVGILSGSPLSDEHIMRATYLDSALSAMNATAVVDPAAAAEVADDDRYSVNVAPLA